MATLSTKGEASITEQLDITREEARTQIIREALLSSATDHLDWQQRKIVDYWVDEVSEQQSTYDPHADHGFTDFRDNPFYNREAFESDEEWHAAIDAYRTRREAFDDEFLGQMQERFLASLSPHDRRMLEIESEPEMHYLFERKRNGKLVLKDSWADPEDLPF